MAPDSTYEEQWYRLGYHAIAGIDEAGRGCWAGPVVAAAVVLPPSLVRDPAHLPLLDDSKMLTAAQRSASFFQLQAITEGIGIGVVPAYVIDACGIVAATRLAMTVALLSLACPVDALLIDALVLPGLSLPQRALVKGDAQVYSIAAASIVAKVTRDRLMTTAEQAYPGYGFAAHKGYGTAVHRSALDRLGPCVLHRTSFKPVERLVIQAVPVPNK